MKQEHKPTTAITDKQLLVIANKINALYEIKLQLKRSVKLQRQIGATPNEYQVKGIQQVSSEIGKLLRDGGFSSINKAILYRRGRKTRLTDEA